MFFTVLVLLCLYEGVLTARKEEHCNAPDPLIKCKFDVNKVFIPFDEISLLKMCKRLESYYTCYYQTEGEFKCAENGYQGYAAYLKKSELLLADLCKKGSHTYREYLDNAACFGQLQMTLDEVWSRAEQFVDLYYRIEDDIEKAKALMPCLVWTYFLYQMNEAVTAKCPRALSLYMKLIYRPSPHSLYCKTPADRDMAEHIMLDIIQNMDLVQHKSEIQENKPGIRIYEDL